MPSKIAQECSASIAFWISLADVQNDAGRGERTNERPSRYLNFVNTHVKHVLSRVEQWPEDDQDELVQIALEIEARRHGVYHATPEELEAIDEALAAVARGEIASEEEVEVVFAKHRRT